MYRTNPRAKLVAAVAVVAAVASVPLVGAAGTLPAAGAESNSRSVGGHIEDEVVAGEMCASPVGFCTRGTYRGDIRGDFDFTINTLVPASPPGVLLFTGVSTIRTAKGDLICADSGSFNTAPTGGGEGVHLCVITGGTGDLTGASGYLQEVFNFTGTTGSGRYRGVLVTS